MPYNSLLRPIVVSNSTHCQQGPVGPRGKQGIQGDQGIQGIQGIEGAAGAKGDAGAAGAKGDQGIQGIPGTPGTNAPTLPNGQIGFGSEGELTSSSKLKFDSNVGMLTVENIKFTKKSIPYTDPTRGLDSEKNAIIKILGVLEDLGLMYEEVVVEE